MSPRSIWICLSASCIKLPFHTDIKIKPALWIWNCSNLCFFFHPLPYPSFIRSENEKLPRWVQYVFSIFYLLCWSIKRPPKIVWYIIYEGRNVKKLESSKHFKMYTLNIYFFPSWLCKKKKINYLCRVVLMYWWVKKEFSLATYMKLYFYWNANKMNGKNGGQNLKQCMKSS